MAVRLLYTILFIQLHAFIWAQQGTIEFSKTTHDFGLIYTSSSEAIYDFIFKNTGGAPIQIKEVEPFCKCISPIWTMSAVNPGEYGFVKIKFDPGKQAGTFTEKVVITIDDSKTTIEKYLK